MIGSLILKQCLSSDDIGMVVSLVRRATGIEHDKLNEIIVDDFMELDGDEDYFKYIDVVYYCLGAYSGAVDGKTLKRITVDYPDALGKVLTMSSPDLRFCLLSGAGADRTEKSRIKFARYKGMIENRLSNMGFKGFHCFQPGYIYPVTPRNEPGMSYRLMRWMYPLIKRLGSNASIRSDELAQVMFKVGLIGNAPEVLSNKTILLQLEKT